jgi:hypothetical protein
MYNNQNWGRSYNNLFEEKIWEAESVLNFVIDITVEVYRCLLL